MNVRFIRILALLLLFGYGLSAADVKNVIILIPDGTSSPLLSLARWYTGSPLNIDPLICGMVKTFSADSTIADSAPASTAFATGSKSKSGHVGVDKNCKPMYSTLELASQKGMSTGIVVTCQFPHATPADFVANHCKRDEYDSIAIQFVERSPDLVFGGGYKYIRENPAVLDKFKKFHFIDNLEQFRKTDFAKLDKKVWALFKDYRGGDDYLSFDCDRNPDFEPSISEMTEKALDFLSKNEKGFFLMVEGSQVDWAAHSNDPKAALTDFIAFDKAVGVCVDFAKKNGNTLVIVVPDHGNGGISIGAKNSSNSAMPDKYYDKLNIQENIIKPLKNAKHSSRWHADTLLKLKDQNLGNRYLAEFVDGEYGVTLADSVISEIITRLNNKEKSKAIVMLGHKLSEKAFIGWTTTGHTGEDVFLGIYPFHQDYPRGVVDNTDIAKFIAKVLNLGELPRYK